VSDAQGGPYAGVHRMTALTFLARWVQHVPERYETRVRYYGAYATRRRLWWRRRGVVVAGAVEASPGSDGLDEQARTEPSWPALRARRRRWAELLRRVFNVEVTVCPACGGAMRILGFVTVPSVAGRILGHVTRRGIDARAGPWAVALSG
jgi:hypothetical protein